MDLRNQPEQVSPRAAGSSSHGGRDGATQRVLVILLTILAVVALLFVVWRVIGAVRSDSSVKSKQYQALFLTNGQVYFGHLSKINSGYVELTDIYYLQVQQTVQPSSSSSSNSNQQVSLAKLGNELHGPEDQMFVSRAQVLFWENLKNSGKVVQAISNYQSQNK